MCVDDNSEDGKRKCQRVRSRERMRVVLSILSIENDIMQQLNVGNLIEQFADQKLRKPNFY